MVGRWILLLLVLQAVAVAPSMPLGAEEGARVVRVDCDAGEDPAAALSKPGPDTPANRPHTLIVEISGVCRTNLLITYDNVTLRSAPGTRAVLESASGNVAPIVEVRHARDVVVEGLEIRNGHTGVLSRYSGLTLRDAVLTNLTFGLRSTTSETVVRGARFFSNTYAVSSERSDRLELYDTSIDFAGYGILAAFASGVSVEGVVIERAGIGVLAGVAAVVSLITDVRISNDTGATLIVTQDGQIFAHDAQLLGPNSWITVERNGTLYTAGDTVVGSQVQLREGGRLQSSETHFAQNVFVSDIGLARFRGGDIDGQLSCTFGGDAYCSNTEIGQTIGCSACSTPSTAGFKGRGLTSISAPNPPPDLPDGEAILRDYREATRDSGSRPSVSPFSQGQSPPSTIRSRSQSTR